MCPEPTPIEAIPIDALRAVIVAARKHALYFETFFPTMKRNVMHKAAAALAVRAILEQERADTTCQLKELFGDEQEQVTISCVAQILAIADDLPLTAPL